MGLEHNIADIIPQRPPMVMIDGLLNCNDEMCRTSLLIKADNIFVENGKFTEPGLLENIAQTAAAHAGYLSASKNEPVAIGYIAAVKDFEVLALPHAGDMLETEITIANQVLNVTMVQGRLYANKDLMATCEMKIFINKQG